MGSKVINAVVSPPPSANLEDPVEMTFEKNWVRYIGNFFQNPLPTYFFKKSKINVIPREVCIITVLLIKHNFNSTIKIVLD